MSKPIPVIELFGPVIQGEGHLAGQQTHFLRLGGCDYRCEWCDTLYAVLPEQVKTNAVMLDQGQIAHRCIRHDENQLRYLTISGGNPCLYDLAELLELLKPHDFKVNVETQGTLWQDWVRDCDSVTVSPKPPSSGMKFDKGKFGKFDDELATHGNTCLKIVVKDPPDIEWAFAFIEEWAGEPKTSSWDSVYLQTCSPTRAELQLSRVRDIALNRTANIADALLKSGLHHVRLMPQLHTLMYGQVRGV